MSGYDILKTAHVLGACVVFGTGLGIAFFCWFGYRGAVRSGDIGALRSVLRLTVIADAWLTAPAVAFQAASGLALMDRAGWPLLSQWSLAVGSLFLFAGACWIPVLGIQAYLGRMARKVPSVEWLPRGFHLWFGLWFGLGTAAFAAVIALVWLMVAKPLAVV